MQKIKLLSSAANIRLVFDRVVDGVITVMLLFITLALVIAVFRLFLRLGGLIEMSGITGAYLYIFSDVLTLFILVELARALFQSVSSRRHGLIFVIDAGIVFLLRHMMIGLFEHKLPPAELYALSAALLVLGGLRIASLVVKSREEPPKESAQSHR